MSSLKFSMIFVFLLSLSSSLFTYTLAADPTFLSNNCSLKSFTRNSAYQSNINLLLSSLHSNANGSDRFSNATAGQNPDRVYGLFQCRGDITATTCQDCVALASTNATQLCPDKKGAIIWYEECILRYSDSYIFSTAVRNPGIVSRNDTYVTVDPSRFDDLVLGLMNEAAAQAANDPKKFATRRGNSTTSQPLYVLVQCTQDLSNNDCSGCLQEAIAGLQSGRLGGSSLLPSCNCRYESYLFYNENLMMTSQPLPPAPTLVTRPKGKSHFSLSIIIGTVAPITVSVVLFFVGYCFMTRRARKKYNTILEETEALQFGFGTIQEATNGFSTNNKLGQGGFGEVYKGVLSNGQEVAVKRLSRSSQQGAEEFKNEIVLVAKLQHRNLVRLLGFCLEGEEKILVYEFVPNKSLDYFLFDPKKQGQLDWSRRYKIIGGIARGILYLHEDSRLRIIHRDLKSSNVLLDGDMNPKISDFGMARLFGVNQTQANTARIVGTYGYMSPEYAMRGQFSVKSDVYSFGVLVLEIITGKKNSSFYQTDSVGNLLSYAWELWRSDTPMQLLDSNLADSYSRNEVIRCIHMGLLCVQEDPAARPTMETVVLMINSLSLTLPLPKQPALFHGSRAELNKQITSKYMPWSDDNAPITEVYPR